jgi:hypothetical protein
MSSNGRPLEEEEEEKEEEEEEEEFDTVIPISRYYALLDPLICITST